MAFLLNGQPLGVDRPFTDADGTQYPANWLRRASADDKAAVGITEVADPEQYDQRFYWGVGNPKALEDDGEIKGLKSFWVTEQKATAAKLLAATDWYVTRKAETDVAVPSVVSTYRAAVRTTCGTRETEINACTTTDQLAALLTNPAEVPDSEGNMVANTESFITRWPDRLS